MAPILPHLSVGNQGIAYQVHYYDNYFFAQAYKDPFGVHPKYRSGGPRADHVDCF